MSLTLPHNPSLEHLKNQAKALLRAYQANDPAARQRFLSSHPRFASPAGRRRPERPCRLADALLVVAREYGFSGWTQMKDYVETLSGWPEAASLREVRGTVVTPEGMPVPHATVSWIEQTPARSRQRQVTMTDAEGQFRFPEVRPAQGEPFSVTLMAQAPGWAVSFQARRTDPMRLVLRATAALHVAFTDSEGGPLPDLPVRIHRLFERSFGSLEIPSDLPGPWQQRTGTNGECLFSGLPQGVQVQLTVDDERFAVPGFEAGVQLTQEALQTPARICLLPGGKVQGRVLLAEDGKPVPGIYVSAQAVGMGKGGGKAITDSEGVYHISQLRPGVYNIMPCLDFTAGDWEQKATARAIEVAEVKPGIILECQDLILIPGSILTGKVTDKQTGEPLAGISIAIHGPARPRSGSAVQAAHTDSNGIYRARVPAGRQQFYVMGLGRHIDRYEKPEEWVNVAVDTNAIVERDFRLVPSPVPFFKPIRGRVVGPDVKPIARATVFLKPISGFPPHQRELPPRIEADESGHFVLDLPVASVRLCARSGALATEKILLVQGNEEVTLYLKPDVLLTLSGQVLDEFGQPLPGARVSLSEWWLDSGLSTSRTRTDAQGRFNFSDLFPDARYSVWVEADGYGNCGSEPLEVRPGELVELPPISLSRADGFLAGRVVDENGNPVAKQGVRLQSQSNRSQDRYTDTEGYFRFEEIVNEPILLFLYEDAGFAPHRYPARAGDTDLILVKKGPLPEGEGNVETAVRKSPASLRPQKNRREQYLHTGRWNVGQQPGDLRLQPGPPLHAAAWLNTPEKMPDSLQGKIVLIDFWSTSCGPCVAALPAVQKVSEQFAGRGVMVVGWHSAGIEKAALQAFLAARHLTYPVAIDSGDPNQTPGHVMSAYGIHGIPTVAVLDHEGLVRYLDRSLGEAVRIIGNLLAAGI